jgi:hypothetical protein
MFQIIKKISVLIFTFLFVFLSGTNISLWSEKFSEVAKEKNIVDTLYWAKKNKNIVDVGFDNIKKAEAATFSIQTGYYVGNASDNKAITGLGFSPDMVLIKDNTAGGNAGVLLKTSSMPSETTLTLAETDAVLTTNTIQSLDSDGFTIGTNVDVNTANEFYYYVAFDGSDCSASGTFCVGSYTGNGTSQSLTSVGFQPDLVMIKRSGATQGVWKSSSMAGTTSNYFDNVNQLASGGITSLDATGFSVGSNAAVNTASNTYYFVAFKEVSGAMDVGTYTGNATDNRTITSANDAGLTFNPDFLWVKAANPATAVPGVFSIREHYADRSSLFTDAASAANNIQTLKTSGGGFEVGTTANANGSAVTYHYAAFAGVSSLMRPQGSGSFYMNSGSYTGTGAGFSITGLGFPPDLVVIKHNDQATDQHAVFKTRLMVGDRTAYFGNNVAVFTGGITALGADGFTIGTNATVNTSGDTYYWTAFGNAMLPGTTGGSENLFIGQYIGTSRASDVDRLPIAANFITVKRNAAVTAFWSTSNVGNSSLLFNASAGTGNRVTAFTSDGFTLGTESLANTSGGIHDYFLFKSGSRFAIGSYTSNGSVRDITGIGFQPDMVWTKKITGGTARAAAFRQSAHTGDVTQPFIALATFTNGFTNLIKNGFSLGTGVDVNETGGFTYHYAAWDGKTYSQQAFRFFGNTDSEDVGTALANQDTNATLTSTGQAFRLRKLLRVDNGNLYSSGEDFKLQYVDKGAGTCVSPSGGTPSSYTDVTGSTLIAYNNNSTPTDGASMTSNANDPTDGGRTIVNQTYEESNNATNSAGAVLNGQTAKFDFSLIDNGATANTTYCFRVVMSDNSLLDTYTMYPEITTAAASGSLSVDIVDAGGVPVVSPSVSMSPISFSFTNQTATGTFGTSSQKIRVDNGTGTATWTLSIAADGGPTALWDGAVSDYDFNDPTANAVDGADADSVGGRMTIDPSGATITPEGGCTLTNISAGSSSSFSQNVTDSITLASASSGADTGCYWDITDIDISQTIPAEQGAASDYDINMTLSIIAS